MHILVCGGGMIVHDQLLPSLYHLERLGVVSSISICARRRETLAALRALDAHFPGSRFTPLVESYETAIPKLAPRNLAVIALPDQMHYDAVMLALRHDQHVLCVKPLVLTAAESVNIEREARSRGLLVATEYHKRFDDRSLMARRRYRDGLFGEFKLGTACLFEKWFYRRSNFQNWFTRENSDAFTYIGCHYVDLVAFITGLEPAAVSVYGIPDRFPNGVEGWLWTDARVIWSNGACLNVQNALGYPDDGPGSNTQHLTLYCSDGERGAMLRHSDQYRGIEYCYTRNPGGDGATVYHEPSPDYMQLLELGGAAKTPVGYGYRSVEAIVRHAVRVETAADRQGELAAIDREGLLATPLNSRYNERLIEAARLSIREGGREVELP